MSRFLFIPFLEYLRKYYQGRYEGFLALLPTFDNTLGSLTNCF